MTWFLLFSLLILLGGWATLDKILHPFETDLEKVRQSFQEICAERTDPFMELNECLEFEVELWVVTQNVFLVCQVLGGLGLIGLIFLFMKKNASN